MSADEADTAARNAAARLRPTPAEVVASVAVAALSRTSTPPEHSVTISRNAKGVAQFEVTVRGTDAGDAHSEAERIYDALAATYPYPAAPDMNGGTA